MFVEDLIEYLKEFPPETVVWVNIPYSGKQGMVSHIEVCDVGISIETDLQ